MKMLKETLEEILSQYYIHLDFFDFFKIKQKGDVYVSNEWIKQKLTTLYDYITSKSAIVDYAKPNYLNKDIINKIYSLFEDKISEYLGYNIKLKYNIKTTPKIFIFFGYLACYEFPNTIYLTNSGIYSPINLAHEIGHSLEFNEEQSEFSAIWLLKNSNDEYLKFSATFREFFLLRSLLKERYIHNKKEYLNFLKHIKLSDSLKKEYYYAINISKNPILRKIQLFYDQKIFKKKLSMRIEKTVQLLFLKEKDN